MSPALQRQTTVRVTRPVWSVHCTLVAFFEDAFHCQQAFADQECDQFF
jgi:hypothetical protein